MCGILGVTLPPAAGEYEAARQSFFGLFALQHRGQEGAGLATADGAGARILKDTGLVTQLLTEERLRQLPGHHAIGHTRYKRRSRRRSSYYIAYRPYVIHSIFGIQNS